MFFLSLICRFNGYGISFDLGGLHGIQHIFGILSGNLHKGVFVKHINASDKFAGHSAFPCNGAQDISRTDTLFFTDIDEEADHAGRCV